MIIYMKAATTKRLLASFCIHSCCSGSNFVSPRLRFKGKEDGGDFLCSFIFHFILLILLLLYIFIFIFIYETTTLFRQPLMAGLHSSSSSSSSSFQTFASRLLLLLTILPLTLAVFAFVLQWRGGLNDPVTRWSPDHHEFPGMDSALGGPLVQASSHSDCVDLLGRTHSPSFPYFRDWKFDYASDLRPKVSCLFL